MENWMVMSSLQLEATSVIGSFMRTEMEEPPELSSLVAESQRWWEQWRAKKGSRDSCQNRNAAASFMRRFKAIIQRLGIAIDR